MRWSLFFLFASYILLPTSNAIPTPAQVDLDGITYTDSNPNKELLKAGSKIVPQPQRGSLGASILGPQNIPLELQNADLLAPPTTDHGSVPNFKWPFSLSHSKLKKGGWSREQNGQRLQCYDVLLQAWLMRSIVGNMPSATDIAGRLSSSLVLYLSRHP